MCIEKIQWLLAQYGASALTLPKESTALAIAAFAPLMHVSTVKKEVISQHCYENSLDFMYSLNSGTHTLQASTDHTLWTTAPQYHTTHQKVPVLPVVATWTTPIPFCDSPTNIWEKSYYHPQVLLNIFSSNSNQSLWMWHKC